MSKKSAKIDSLERLKMEKSKLQSYCTYQEKLIGYKLEYLRENYAELLSDAVLPYSKSQNNDVNNLLDSVNNIIVRMVPSAFEGKFLPKFMLKLIEILMIQTFNKTRREKVKG
jgi:hypothetical protein